MGSLPKLASLVLWGCKRLRELPGTFSLNTSLKNLDLDSCYGLIKLPDFAALHARCGLKPYVNTAFTKRWEAEGYLQIEAKESEVGGGSDSEDSEGSGSGSDSEPSAGSDTGAGSDAVDDDKGESDDNDDGEGDDDVDKDNQDEAICESYDDSTEPSVPQRSAAATSWSPFISHNEWPTSWPPFVSHTTWPPVMTDG